MRVLPHDLGDPSDEDLEVGAIALNERPEALIIMSQIQVLLSEKRTSLSVFRTGMVLLAFPISVVTVLTTTSGYYSTSDVWELLVFLLAVCVTMVILGIYMILRSFKRVRRIDDRVDHLKNLIRPLMDTIGDLLGK